MDHRPGVPIVAIGASAGGVEALSTFFRHLPRHAPAAFLVITHLSPNHESRLPQILGRFTAMPAVSAANGMPIAADTVYILPPDRVLTLVDDHMALSERGGERNVIDVCFASLAGEAPERTIGIILSGTGSDGAIGLGALRAAGGITFAQGTNGSTPSHHGMPDAAIATGAVDFVLPIEILAARVGALVNSMLPVPHSGAGAEKVEEARRELLALLQERVGHDFSGYKRNTFMRRVERRMNAHALADVPSYLEFVKSEPDEVMALFRDLLIGVTDFFRDPASFDSIGKIVASRLLPMQDPSAPLRVWVPGCATGEEAYSIAITVLEALGPTNGRRVRLQVFATDIDERALGVARAGRFPQRLLKGMSQQRIDRFFHEDGSSYVVAKELREVCLFSCHSLVRDPPFSRLDLISCRNLLIYLDTDLQNQVMPLFHYALRPGGLLFLGSSEHVSQHANLFTPLDKKHRIFERRDVPSRPTLFPVFRQIGMQRLAPLDEGRPVPARQEAVRRCEALVLNRYAPAHVMVDRDGEVIHFSAS